VIVAIFIAGLFIFDVCCITGKFAAFDDEKLVSCETNSRWINPFNVREILRFDKYVTVSPPVGGKNLTMIVLIDGNGTTLYKSFSSQDSLTTYIKTTVRETLNRIRNSYPRFDPVTLIGQMLDSLPKRKEIQWIHTVNLN